MRPEVAASTPASTASSFTPARAGGANESTRRGFQDVNVAYRGAVVHHTAGSNGYTEAQVPGIIRSIYHYHAVTQDWGDMGYQLLVDKFGGVWEGRYGSLTRTVRGAQAFGANNETFGISVLGTYVDAPPPQEAMDAVARAIAWKFGVHRITNPAGKIRIPGGDGKGREVSTIMGHYDVAARARP